MVMGWSGLHVLAYHGHVIFPEVWVFLISVGWMDCSIQLRMLGHLLDASHAYPSHPNTATSPREFGYPLLGSTDVGETGQ